MRNHWLERILDSVADRGRELLKSRPVATAHEDIGDLCRALIEGRGEASGIALSREILNRYEAMDGEHRAEFFELLHRDFGADPDRIREATDTYLATRSVEDFLDLNAAVEPLRQELLRRLNMAPSATGQLVVMRGDLLDLLGTHAHLRDVDADFLHLLSSWFNRGFLRIQRIDWHTPADILERLMGYEVVQPIRGWGDLRRRMAEDRRCFAFFHPAMPDEPLIFIEVALVQGLTDHAAPLLDPDSPVLPPHKADSATFYSINNSQAGLRGVSFGNFLIKQVLAELREELPWIRQFATLSPLPRFAPTVHAAIRGEAAAMDAAYIDALLAEWAGELTLAAGVDSAGRALVTLLESGAPRHGELVAEPLRQLTLAYLTHREKDGGLIEPVASFHLSNGARMERINVFADASPRRMRESFGVMVNFVYDPEEVETHHELFVTEGGIAMSRTLARIYRKLEPIRSAAAAGG